MVVLVTHVQMKSYAFKIDQINQTFLGIFFFVCCGFFNFIYLFIFNLFIFKYIIVFDFEK